MTTRAYVPISSELSRPDVACAGADLTDFFPDDKELTGEATTRMRWTAWQYCAHCPITEACRTEGTKQGFGLWGGVLFRPKGGTLAKASVTAIDLLAVVG